MTDPPSQAIRDRLEWFKRENSFDQDAQVRLGISRNTLRHTLAKDGYAPDVIELLSNAPEDIAYLLAELDRLTAELAEAQEAFKEIHDAACEVDGKLEIAEATLARVQALPRHFEPHFHIMVVKADDLEAALGGDNKPVAPTGAPTP